MYIHGSTVKIISVVHNSESGSLTAVIAARGYTRKVSAPRASSVWIRGVKVPDQDNKQHDHQRKSGQSESPRNETVSLAWGDNRVKDHADQESHQEATQMCKVVDIWDESDSDTNDQVNGQEYKPSLRPVDVSPMSKQINPLYSEHPENCARGTDRWYSRTSKVSTKNIAENTSGRVGDEESRGTHLPLDLSSGKDLREHI